MASKEQMEHAREKRLKAFEERMSSPSSSSSNRTASEALHEGSASVSPVLRRSTSTPSASASTASISAVPVDSLPTPRQSPTLGRAYSDSSSTTTSSPVSPSKPAPKGLLNATLRKILQTDEQGLTEEDIDRCIYEKLSGGGPIHPFAYLIQTYR
jgi:hypothetical protein